MNEEEDKMQHFKKLNATDVQHMEELSTYLNLFH